jgi:hypothetical protein
MNVMDEMKILKMLENIALELMVSNEIKTIPQDVIAITTLEDLRKNCRKKLIMNG